MVLISVKEGMKGEKLLRILLNTMREYIKTIRLRKSRSLRTFRVEKNLLSKGNVYKKFLRYLFLQCIINTEEEKRRETNV